MATQVLVTNAGLAAINTAIANNTTLDITKFSIGDSAGYTPTKIQTDIQGTEVFNQDDPDAEDGATLSVLKIGDYAYEIKLFLDGTIGNFTVGEYAFKLSDGTLFAIGVLQAVTQKTKNTSVITGNSILLRGVFSIGNANDTINIDVDETVYNSVNVVATEASLPGVNTGGANIYQVRNYNGTGVSAIAIKDIATDSWKYYQQPKVTVDNEILLGKLTDKTPIGSGITISNDTDFDTANTAKVPTKYGVKTFVNAKIDALLASAPGTLDTLNELAAALGNDANFAATVTSALAGKMAISQNLNDVANKATARSNLDVYQTTQVYTKTFLNNMIGKNALINGEANIWQRNTTFTGIADAAYSVDRFQYAKSGTMVHDIIRSTDVPTFAQAGRLFNYSILLDCTTADSSIASGDYCAFNHTIEGYNWLNLAQRIVTLSFWVKGTKIGIHSVAIRNGGADRYCIQEYTINTTDTWEFKTITFPASPSAGTWNYANGLGLTIHFMLAGGSAVQGTTGSWQTGGAVASANQVNACDNTNNNFRLAGIQLECGDSFTGYEGRCVQDELTYCQRYFEKSYNLANAVGSVGDTEGLAVYSNQSSQQNKCYVKFSVRKRGTTVGAVYSYVTGTVGKVYNGADRDAGAFNPGETGFHVTTNSSQSLSDVYFHWTASSEL